MNTNIENKLKAYLDTLDGSPKEFSSVEHLFNDLYHDNFELAENGSTIDREQMKQAHKKLFTLGSRADLLELSSDYSSSVDFKFRLTNEHWSFVVHGIATVKDSKLYKVKPVESSKSLLSVNFQACIDAFDGTAKDFSEISNLFEKVYHDEFVYHVEDKLINKKLIKQYQSDFIGLGSKAILLLFRELSRDTVEFKFRITNDEVDVIVHNVAKVKDNKFIVSEPVDDASVESVTKICQACEAYESELALIEVGKLPFRDSKENVTRSAPK
jgi:hypothetical protein